MTQLVVAGLGSKPAAVCLVAPTPSGRCSLVLGRAPWTRPLSLALLLIQVESSETGRWSQYKKGASWLRVPLQGGRRGSRPPGLLKPVCAQFGRSACLCVCVVTSKTDSAKEGKGKRQEEAGDSSIAGSYMVLCRS